MHLHLIAANRCSTASTTLGSGGFGRLTALSVGSAQSRQKRDQVQYLRFPAAHLTSLVPAIKAYSSMLLVGSFALVTCEADALACLAVDALGRGMCF